PHLVEAEPVGELDLCERVLEHAVLVVRSPRPRQLQLVEHAELHDVAPFASCASRSAAAFSTAVPLKKFGFMPPCRRTAFAKVKSRKSWGVISPSLTRWCASTTTVRMSLTSKCPMSEPSMALNRAPKGFSRVSNAAATMRSSPSH